MTPSDRETAGGMAGELIVVSGLPGTGKTAVAQALADRIGAVHLSIDPVENAMLGAGVERGWNTGVAAYEAVRVMAQANLVRGLAVVVDAVNDSEAARDTWRRAGADAAVPVHFFLLRLDDEAEHRRRLEGRERAMEQVVEPTWEAVQARADAYEPWIGTCIEVDASKSLNQIMTGVLDALRRDSCLDLSTDGVSDGT
jgi:predicted kinase